ncbi:MAG: heme biosynthesis HemY N-terminal domain-containing protein [Gammaproteobacteria bacterium]
MRLLILALLALIAGVILALFAHQDNGYVLIARGHTTIETSLVLALILLIAGFIGFYTLLRMIAGTWHLPRQVRHRRQERLARRARRASNKGLIELSEGHWAAAEKALLKHARDSETPLLNYLSAARAAQKQNAPDRRDHYLALAHQSMPDADMAVELTQAELQLAHGQLEQSLATLMHLQSMAPKHPHVLFLLARLFQQLKSWGDLEALLPSLRKYQVLAPDDLQALERQVWHEQLALAARSGKADRLQATWEKLPRALRRDALLVEQYARHLICLEQGTQAEALLRDQIRREWSDRLVYLYGLAAGEDAGQQLNQAEQWLKGRDRNATLLLTLGRLCVRSQLWGKARSYLEASIGAGATPEAYKELGALLVELGEPQEATECYRKGLETAAEDAVCSALDVPRASRPAGVAPQSAAYSKLSKK